MVASSSLSSATSPLAGAFPDGLLAPPLAGGPPDGLLRRSAGRVAVLWEELQLELTARGKARGGVRPDRKLTGEAPVRLAGPEEGRRWRILAAASSGACGEMATGGGDSELLGSITSTERKSAMRRTCRAH
jgi:hypothetical protein